MNRLCILWMTTILLTGCATATFTPTPTLPPTAEILNTLPDPTDNTQLITAQAGETFDIVLSSNPSTGYHWEVIPELDESIVQFASQNYLAEEPVMPGSGGVDVWTFRAVNEGDTTIVLGYYPPGDEIEPDDTLTL